MPISAQFCSSSIFNNACISMPLIAQPGCSDVSVDAGRRNGCLRDPTVQGPKLQPRKRHVVRILGPLPKMSRAPGATIRMPPRRDERWERTKMGPAYIDSVFATAVAISRAYLLRRSVLSSLWNAVKGRSAMRAQQF